MSASSLPLPQGKSVSLKQFVSRHINEIGLLVVIAILYLVFSLNAPGFISLNNQMNVLRDAVCICNTAILTFCLLPCSVRIITFFDKVSHFSKRNELISDNFVILVKSNTGYITFCHL